MHHGVYRCRWIEGGEEDEVWKVGESVEWVHIL